MLNFFKKQPKNYDLEKLQKMSEFYEQVLKLNGKIQLVGFKTRNAINQEYDKINKLNKDK